MKVVDGSSLAVAVLLNRIPRGTTQVVLRGKLTKVAYALAFNLCQRGIKVRLFCSSQHKKKAELDFGSQAKSGLGYYHLFFWVCYSPMGFYANTFILWKHGVIQCSVLLLHFAQSKLIHNLNIMKVFLDFFFSLYASQNTKSGIENFYSTTRLCGNQFKWLWFGL